ncbi:MAG: MATE family efflux transporter [Treponema sp.]|nr:MATE family efflux transporter [Treponema sp.]
MIDWNNRRLFRLFWPLVVEQLLAVTMGAADTMMVRYVGEAAVAGVNIIDNINNLFIIAFTALSTGGAVVVSQYIGRRNEDQSRCASRQLYYIVIFAAFAVMIPAMIWNRLIIRMLYGVIDNKVMEAASVYFFITAASYPFLGIYNACAALSRAAGNSRIPMGIALMVNVTNIAGNSVFIFGLGLGAEGAAVSTLISRVIAAAVLTLMLLKQRGAINLSGLLDISFKRAMIGRILKVGIPSGIESSMFQIGRLLTQRIFSTFGTAAMAGNAIASVINAFSYMPGMAFGMGLLTIVGQCVGAGDYKAAKKYTARVMKMTYVMLFIISAAIFIFKEPMIGLFYLSEEAHRLTTICLSIHCVSMALSWSMSFVLPNALRAAGDARFVMIISVVSMFAVRVSSAYLITYTLGAGPMGVWLAMGLDFIVRGGLNLWRWLGGGWQKMRVI